MHGARILSGGGRLVPPGLPQRHVGLVSYTVHNPRSGRASRQRASRRDFRPYVPASSEETATVFAADSDTVTEAFDLDWISVRMPGIAVVQDDENGAYLRMYSGDHPGPSGISRHLYVAPFVGRTSVCQVRTHWGGRRRDSSGSRLAVFGSKDADIPIVRLATPAIHRA